VFVFYVLLIDNCNVFSVGVSWRLPFGLSKWWD
jgi:hypothetical protein